MSLRRRLLAVSLLTLAVGLGALLAVGNVLLRAGVQAQASSVLRARAEAQLAALTVSGRHMQVRETPNDEVLDRRSWVLTADRVIERPVGVSAQLDAAAVAMGRQRRVIERDGPDDIRLRALPVRAPSSRLAVGAVVVGYAMAPLERLQHDVVIGSLVFAALVLLAGFLTTRGALEGALQPVAQMTAHAEDWGAHDLDRRFGLGPARDELTALAATLDGLLSRIAASRRHEQRFASEVAHELRTPLAVLRGRAELALAARGADADAERAEALQALVDDATRLEKAVDALLAVARRELDMSDAAVDLAALAREIDGVELTVHGPIPLAEGDPDVVRRALAPLIDNARRYARDRVALELDVDAGRVRLAVRDDGTGLDPKLGERAFEPGTQGEDSGGGAGLGLPLARRLARSCGGDVRAEPGPGGCFVLELPAVQPVR
ncbi:sensor histidine kinase [Candidatus Solirubrobacter pratensis]|uniref:sensor histidine kinase n=1 Tax=Candidatus Solirubrobacter pratensis TaxID=1298857 RepID=UPI0004108549|nr:HAMP domain-containing sensor histidine kinase [Candidatus Solirubrobacter pratensis]